MNIIIEIVLSLLAIFWSWRYYKLRDKHINFLQEAENKIKKALDSSRNTIRGKIGEEIVPLLPNFPYTLADAKFSGNPVDYIVFDGMSEFRDGNNEKEITIIFADIKYNTASNSRVQTAIKRAIEEGRVKWENIKLDKEFNIKQI